MTEHGGGASQNDALFLRHHNGAQFEALSRITGQAAGILAVRALTENAWQRDIKVDVEVMGRMTTTAARRTAGPVASQNTFYNQQGESILLPPSTVTITAPLDNAPTYTPPRNSYITDNLEYDGGLSAFKYLSKPIHGPFMDLATGRFSHYYGALSEIELPNASFMHIRTPIGEYGPDAAVDLLQATYQTMRMPDAKRLAKLDALADEGDNRRLVLEHTTFGRHYSALYMGSKNYTGPIGILLARTVHEGDLSIQQAVSLLTAQRVDGFETMGSLWSAVRRARLVEKLTSLLPFGNLAAANDMNIFIPELVVPTGTGEVRLNAGVEAQLRAYKAQSRARIAAFHRENPKEPARDDMGIMCPALVRGAGLSERHSVLYARFTGQYPRPRGLLRRFF